jgi:hypothetical protein
MATVDTDSDDGAWKDYIESVRNHLGIKIRDLEEKEE